MQWILHTQLEDQQVLAFWSSMPTLVQQRCLVFVFKPFVQPPQKLGILELPIEIASLRASR
jgi:hypothetical protein